MPVAVKVTPKSIYVTRMIPQAGLDILIKTFGQVDVNPKDEVLAREELLTAVKGRDGVLCLLTDTIDAEVLDAAKGCKVFANFAVGYDNIDVPEATRRGIIVTNTPGVLTDATADLTWALLLSVARRIPEGDRFTRSGNFKGWGPLLLLGLDVAGKTLGIVGAGRIGTAVALRSSGFRMKVLYTDFDKNDGLERKLAAKRVPFEQLLRESDFISLHVPLSQETHHMIGQEQLRMMKPGAFLINTSRGPVVDEEALVRALKEKRIAGVALDVYENEPRLSPGLAELENVVLAPHLGSATVQTRTKMAVMAAENLIAAVTGKTPANIVNPEAMKRATRKTAS